MDEVSDEEIAASVRGAIAHMRSHPLDAHAQEIGRLCMLWGRLETAVTILLDMLMDISHRDTLNIILGVLDFRTKIQIAAPIAFSKKGNSAWFQKLQNELNSIDNDLRPERNRMIHDFWYAGIDGEPARRLQLGARGQRPERPHPQAGHRYAGYCR